MATIEVAREDFGDPTDTKPVTCFCIPGQIRTVNHAYALPGWNRLVTPMSGYISVVSIGIEPTSSAFQTDAKPSQLRHQFIRSS